MPHRWRDNGIFLSKDFWCSRCARLSFPTYPRLRAALHIGTFRLVFSKFCKCHISHFGKSTEKFDWANYKAVSCYIRDTRCMLAWKLGSFNRLLTFGDRPVENGFWLFEAKMLIQSRQPFSRLYYTRTRIKGNGRRVSKRWAQMLYSSLPPVSRKDIFYKSLPADSATHKEPTQRPIL